MTTIGKLQNLKSDFFFNWEIDGFLSLLEEVGKKYSSPSFLFDGESWHLNIYPCVKYLTSKEDIGIFLCREQSGPQKELERSFSLKTVDGKNDCLLHGSSVFKINEGRGYSCFLKRSELLDKKSVLVPAGVLTIVCSIKSCSKSTDDLGNNETVIDDECISTHEQKIQDNPIRCLTCNNEVTIRECSDNECPVARVKADAKLQDDLVGIFNSEEYSDVTITVKNKEFRLHRTILAGRNLYFKALLNTEMKEKATGVICIKDCEPEIFGTFIHFVYTGKINDLTSENVCDLFRLADKCQEDNLKIQCLCFMKKQISVDNFCDFIILSLEYDEKELLKYATEFFCKNTKEIIRSVKWQNFLKQYSTQANELYMKAFDNNVSG